MIYYLDIKKNNNSNNKIYIIAYYFLLFVTNRENIRTRINVLFIFLLSFLRSQIAHTLLQIYHIEGEEEKKKTKLKLIPIYLINIYCVYF